MSKRDLVRLVVANLNRMRARVVLTSLGVLIGTAAVVLLVSLSVGLQSNLVEQMGAFGDLTLIEVSPGSQGLREAGGRRTGQAARLDAEAMAEISKLPGVVVATPKSSLQGAMELRWGRETTYAPFVQGIEPRAAEKMGWSLQSGVPRLARGQVIVGPKLFEDAPFVMISAGTGVVAEEEQGRAVPTETVDLQGRTLLASLTRFDDEGKEVSRGERLRVVGVFEPTGGINDVAIYMSRADVEAYNEWTTGQRRSARDGYESAVVKVDDPASVASVQAAIDARGLTSYSSQQIAQGLGQFFLVVRLVLGGIGAIALLVAAFGIANTMTMAIYERTKEIGIMKAVGATNRDVLDIFLGEAGAIGALGGVLGVLLGWLGGKGVNLALQLLIARSASGGQSADQPLPSLLVTPLWLAAFAIAFATLVGLVSGIYPALRAAAMKPLHALRTD